jgi:hypothetical protein
VQQRSHSFLLRSFRTHWQCYDRFFQRKPARHLAAKRALQEAVRSNFLQNNPQVNRQGNRCISCKHGGIRLRDESIFTCAMINSLVRAAYSSPLIRRLSELPGSSTLIEARDLGSGNLLAPANVHGR